MYASVCASLPTMVSGHRRSGSPTRSGPETSSTPMASDSYDTTRRPCSARSERVESANVGVRSGATSSQGSLGPRRNHSSVEGEISRSVGRVMVRASVPSSSRA